MVSGASGFVGDDPKQVSDLDSGHIVGVLSLSPESVIATDNPGAWAIHPVATLALHAPGSGGS